MAEPKRLDPASAEFASAELGDARLTRRLMGIADAVAASPADSFPRAVSGDGELEGVYRFLSNDRVTPKGILAPHFAATRERASGGDVLVVHDTTPFSFGGWHKREGLGRFRSGAGQGFFGHFAIAVSADGQRRPLGVVGLKTIVRKGPRKPRGRKAAGPSEFDRWADLALEVHAAIPNAIHVMDREADALSIFDALVTASARFVSGYATTGSSLGRAKTSRGCSSTRSRRERRCSRGKYGCRAEPRPERPCGARTERASSGSRRCA